MSDINIDLDAFECILRDARAAGLPAIARPMTYPPSYRYLGEKLGFERVNWPWRVVEEPLPPEEPPLVGDLTERFRLRTERWHAHEVRDKRSDGIIWLFLREGVEPTEDLLRRFETTFYSGRLTPRREHVPDPPKVIEWSLTSAAQEPV